MPAEPGDVLPEREHVLHLRQDLTLAHDDGVEAARHLQEVARRVLVAQQKEVLAQILEGMPLYWLIRASTSRTPRCHERATT